MKIVTALFSAFALVSARHSMSKTTFHQSTSVIYGEDSSDLHYLDGHRDFEIFVSETVEDDVGQNQYADYSDVYSCAARCSMDSRCMAVISSDEYCIALRNNPDYFLPTASFGNTSAKKVNTRADDACFTAFIRYHDVSITFLPDVSTFSSSTSSFDEIIIYYGLEPSFVDCERRCFKSASCLSYSYNYSESQCYGFKTVQLTSHTPSSGDIWYNGKKSRVCPFTRPGISQFHEGSGSASSGTVFHQTFGSSHSSSSDSSDSSSSF